MLKNDIMKIRRYYYWWFRTILVSFILLGIIYLTKSYLNESEEKKYQKDELEANAVKPQIDTERHYGNILTKDWHDYKQIELEHRQTGPGEQGQAYFLPQGLEHEKDALFKANGFNARASDDISLNRSLSDIRHEKCKEKKYQETLPTTSVIIPFYNEHWSTLLRTVTSVINRSPSELLIEVILVDDGSTKEFLGEKLSNYVKEHFSKVRILRSETRKGLISARLMGAKEAFGEVLVFLDSHTECATNWLPPLLSPIASDPKTCVCPFIDVIDFENFAYRAQDDGARGAFDWQLFYKRLPLMPEDRANMPEPFKSPVMAGGLFAIDTKFFWKLGGYDPGLQIWGGEQYELSFKIWQCGGTMVDAPCSRVGHIYRKFSPFSHSGAGNYLARNHKRVAEVWMDEYANYVYKHSPFMKNINPGDLTEQKAVRERLRCKSFKWFIKNIAFDLMKVYPPVEPPDFANGSIRSKGNPSYCIDTKFKGHEERFGLGSCNYGGGSQLFHLTWRRDIRPESQTLCWDVSSSDEQAPVLLYHCHGAGGNQYWKYDYRTQALIHGQNNRCLDTNEGRLELFVTECQPNKLTQQWIFEKYNTDLLDNWHKDVDMDL